MFYFTLRLIFITLFTLNLQATINGSLTIAQQNDFYVYDTANLFIISVKRTHYGKNPIGNA